MPSGENTPDQEVSPSEETNESEVLRAFVQIAPHLKELFHEDVAIAVSNTEKLLTFIPCETFQVDMKEGDLIPESSSLKRAIQEDRVVAHSIPPSVYGKAVSAKAIPLYDKDGHLIGAISVKMSAEKYNQLYQISSNLSTAVEQVSATMNEMAKSVSDLASNINQVAEQADKVNQSLNEIDKVALTVGEIADQSNLLGLNAAIESARAGEHGRGFAVVADEVRKMATTSKNYAVDINNTTAKIRELIEQLNRAVAHVNQESESQSAAIEEIAATMEEISGNAQSLTAVTETMIENK